MAGEVVSVKPSYSTLDCESLVSTVLCDYDIEAPVKCVFWERGVNDTYEVRAANARYSLRVYRHQLRERDHVEFELAALLHLQEQGASVAYPIAKKDGSYITEIHAPEGLRYSVLTIYADGKRLSYDSADDSKLFGESAASVHKLSDNFSSTFERPRLEVPFLLDTSLAIIKPYIEHRPEDIEFIDATAATLRAAVNDGLNNTESESPETGFCHGDYHGGNVHNADGVLTHYDFDCCGMGYRVFDLATFKWSAFLDGDMDARWPAFLEGYQSVRAVRDVDLALVDTFVVIRHFWLMALHMSNAADFGHGVTSDGYIDYQLGKVKSILKITSAPQSKDTTVR